MSNKELKRLEIHNLNTVQVMYYSYKFPPETSNRSHNLESFFVKLRFHGTTEHCHGPPELGSQQPWIVWKYTIPLGSQQHLFDEVLLWCCSEMPHVWVLVSLSRMKEKTSFLCKRWTYHTTVVSRIWALGAFHAIQAGCYISSCSSGNDICPISHNQRMVLQETIQTKWYKMHKATFCQKIYRTCCILFLFVERT